MRWLVTVMMGTLALACGSHDDPPRGLDLDLDAMTKTASGLYYQDLVVGTGPEASTNTRVTVHYTGWLTDGTKFDSSHDRGEPYALSLPGPVIDGWNLGIPGMRVGGTRRLVIPAELGYGSTGAAPVIPPNATLVFEIELLGVESI